MLFLRDSEALPVPVLRVLFTGSGEEATTVGGNIAVLVYQIDAVLNGDDTAQLLAFVNDGGTSTAFWAFLATTANVQYAKWEGLLYVNSGSQLALQYTGSGDAQVCVSGYEIPLPNL